MPSSLRSFPILRACSVRIALYKTRGNAAGGRALLRGACARAEQQETAGFGSIHHLFRWRGRRQL